MRFLFMAAVMAVASLVLSTSGLNAQQPGASCLPQTGTICVSQPKETTRKTYACKIEVYCLPRCSLLSLLGGACGCDQGSCGDLKVRHRLIVKKVPGCDT